MKQVILFTTFSLLVLSCSQKKKADKKWPLVEQNGFLESCFENAKGGIGEENAKKYCACMLEKVMKKYPVVSDANKMTLGETMELAKECSE